MSIVLNIAAGPFIDRHRGAMGLNRAALSQLSPSGQPLTSGSALSEARRPESPVDAGRSGGFPPVFARFGEFPAANLRLASDERARPRRSFGQSRLGFGPNGLGQRRVRGPDGAVAP